MLARLEDSVLIVIDMQPSFLNGIWQASEILQRTKFLVECANLLDVRVIATEQNFERMGGTDQALRALIKCQPIDKMTFSCCGANSFIDQLVNSGRKQVIICGIESHICVNQTAHHLVEKGFELIVCPDAVSARTEHRHKEGVKRLRDLGVTLAHSEAVVYEWMQTAAHPAFRSVLAKVKSYS